MTSLLYRLMDDDDNVWNHCCGSNKIHWCYTKVRMRNAILNIGINPRPTNFEFRPNNFIHLNREDSNRNHSLYEIEKAKCQSQSYSFDGIRAVSDR